MSVTPSAVNQSAISSSAPVNEANVRVSLRRPRPAVSGVRTQATTSFLPISIPAQRSISTSTTDLLVSIPTGQDRQGQPIHDAVRRARGQKFEVPGRPLASVAGTVTNAPSASELSRSHRDSHPSRRPETGHGFSEHKRRGYDSAGGAAEVGQGDAVERPGGEVFPHPGGDLRGGVQRV